MGWSVRKFLPKTRMGIFTFILVVLWILKTLLLSSATQQALSTGQQLSLNLITLLLVIPVAYYSWKFFSLLKRKLLWKIRRRLILAHIFIGAIPVLVVVVILYVSALLVYYQLSYYLILNQIGIHTAQIHGLNLTLRMAVEQGISNSPGTGLESVLERESRYVLANYPSASITVQIQDRATGQSAVFATRKVKPKLRNEYQIPRWLGEREFSGLVVDDSDQRILSSSERTPVVEKRGSLYLRSVIFSNFRPETPFSVEVSVPFDRYLLGRLKTALGLDLLLASHVATPNLNVMLQNIEILRANVLCATFDLEQDRQSVARSLWSILLYPISWNTGSENSTAETEVLFVELSSSKLIQNIFLSESHVSKTILGALKIVIGFFLAVEIISIVIGIVLTKSITNAVYNLDRGTEFVKRGNFSNRIVVKSEDQLGALAKSFNQMTEYVQALVRERVQKERLERELEIAKEVQEQLFPRHAPRLERMELTGLCLPARVVSGDYYDFLQIDAHRLGMALGDICGKGISAALLMANLQAALRSNVMNLLPDQHDSSDPVRDDRIVAQVVKMLNRQIYNHTAANKFASFFYAVYDDARCTLTYCNAGHNPPLYFANGGYQRLSTGGTVVGILPEADYEQATFDLHPGDLVVAYTDGIVECVNEYGEEFGEQRLIELVARNRGLSASAIQKIIVDQVLDWSYEEERDDDMTLVIGKIL